ncbi:L-dopachrome tautomerase yellow-f-like [Armigeres subalbatus]|uniref:L-dopachrome tautomerase yellow-f-like n=1 Tax=Armigeres subalbatus TaxID=124917 RepID=UPI002ED1B2D1
MNRLIVFISLIVTLRSLNGEQFELVFKWKQLQYNDIQTEPGDIVFSGPVKPAPPTINETFVSYNNIPMGATHHKGRVFISVPRRRPGIPATLNVIDIEKQKKGNKSPALTAYPENRINQLHLDYHADLKHLVSVYRTTVDQCQRLWFVDTGMLEYPNNTMQVQRPQLWIIDLSRDRKVRTFEIPESIVQQGVGMASLVVDSDATTCDKSYAYIPDLVQGAIYVYSFEANRMWAFRHSSFQHDPQRAAFNVAGQRFNWDDGVFSITIGNRDPVTRSRPVYYHPMVSTSEFITFTEVLQNEALATNGGYDNLFQAMGDRGSNTQSTMHHFDDQSQVIFYAEVNRNTIGCWNTRSNFSAENHDIIHHDNERLIYPTDLSADASGVIWVLSNNLPTWIYSQLDVNEYNFYLWRQTPAKAIEGTKCKTEVE